MVEHDSCFFTIVLPVRHQRPLKACCSQEQDTATVLSKQSFGAAGSTAGKEGAGVAALPEAVAAAGRSSRPASAAGGRHNEG